MAEAQGIPETKEAKKIPYEQIDRRPKEIGMNIDGPHIEWLTEKVQRILIERRIPSRIACKTPRNPMFENVKDQIPIEEKGNTIFSMACRKCGERTNLDTGHGTVGEEVQRTLAKCKEGHTLDEGAIRKKMAYTDKRKAVKIIYVLKNIMASEKCPFSKKEKVNPETRYKKKIT